MDIKVLELQYIKLLNEYFHGAEALQIAQAKCRKNHIYHRRLILLHSEGYGGWLKEVLPKEFKMGLISYAKDFRMTENFFNEKIDLTNKQVI